MSGPQGGGPPPAGAPEEGEKRDLRTVSRRDLGVEVERELTGSGRLARGGSTRFSALRFRSVGSPAPGVAESVAEPREAVEPEPLATAAGAAEPERETRPSLGRRILRMLGLG